MGFGLTAWAYPLYGLLYLLTTPALWKQVAKFAAVALSASLVCIVIWFHAFYSWHLQLLGHVFGQGLFGRLVTTLVLLSESAAPCYLIFDHRFKRLQKQLLLATLQQRLGALVAPFPEPTQQLIQNNAARQFSRQAGAPSAQPKEQPGSSVSVGSLAWSLLKLLVPSSVKESRSTELARKLLTLPLKLAAPFLVPIFAYAEGYTDTTQLLSTYWDAKGVPSAEGQQFMALRHFMEYRSFGFVAISLKYIPVFNWVLGLSNAVGAGLWAAHLERKQAAGMAGQAPKLQ